MYPMKKSNKALILALCAASMSVSLIGNDATDLTQKAVEKAAAYAAHMPPMSPMSVINNPITDTIAENIMQGKPPLDGMLSAAADKTARYVNGYITWEESNPRLAKATLFGAKVTAAGARDAVLAFIKTRSPQATVLAAANSVAQSAIGEIKSRIIEEAIGEKFQAMMHDAATKTAPMLMKLDSTLTPEKAVYLASITEAGIAYSTHQFSKIAKGVHHIPQTQMQFFAEEAKHAFSHPVETTLHTLNHQVPEAAYANIKESEFMQKLETQQNFESKPAETVNTLKDFVAQTTDTIDRVAHKMTTAYENQKNLFNQAASQAHESVKKMQENFENKGAETLNSLKDFVAQNFNFKASDIQAQDEAFIKAYESLPNQLPSTAKMSELLAEHRLETLNPTPDKLPATARLSELLEEHRNYYSQPMPTQNQFFSPTYQPFLNQLHNDPVFNIKPMQMPTMPAWQPQQFQPFNNFQPMQPVQMPNFDNLNPGGFYNWQQDLHNFGGQFFRN